MIHKDGDLFVSSALRELEENRKKDLFSIYMWLGGPLLCVGLVVAWFYFNSRDPLAIVGGTLFCNFLFLFGLWRSNRIRKNYNEKIRRQIIVPLINEFIPEADTATGRSGHSVDSFFQSKIVMNMHRSSQLSFIENGIVHIPLAGIGAVQFSDFELKSGHGKHQTQLFDGLVGFLKGDFAFRGVARFQVPKRNWKIFPWWMFTTSVVVLAVAAGLFFSGLALAPEVIVSLGVITLFGVVGMVVTCSQYLNNLKIEENLEKTRRGLWWKEPEFEKFFPNLKPIENRIIEFYEKHKSQTIVSMTPKGIYIAFPQITDFMEVSLRKSLVSRKLQTKWNHQVEIISQVVQLLGELVGLLGGLNQYQPVAGLDQEALEGANSVHQPRLVGVGETSGSDEI